jgi:hypothetical protein
MQAVGWSSVSAERFKQKTAKTHGRITHVEKPFHSVEIRLLKTEKQRVLPAAFLSSVLL